jgi:PAS domain S-box-containing protein
MAAFPLKDASGTFGVFAIYASEPGFFDAEETRLLEDMTEDIIFGVGHIRQNAELHHTTEALSEEVAVKNGLLERLNADIAERRRVEEALLEANAALDALVESSPLPVIALDGEARVRIWNSAAERLLGWKREETLGKQDPNMPPEAREKQRALLHHLLKQGGRVEGLEQRLYAKDGRPVDVLLYAAPVRVGDEPPRLAVSVFQDVTQRKQIEQLKADFISAVSHELRTPLTTMVGYSEMLRDVRKSGDARRRREMADRLHEKAIELQRLLEQLLEAASIQAGSTTLSIVRTDMRALLDEVLEETIVPADVDVVVEIGDGLTGVCVDRARFSQAVGSLLSNAFKYSPDGGRVEVDARAEGERLLVSVADAGVGIRPEQLDVIFDLFTQADMSSTRSFGGLGLGLYMAKQVVEAHGGEIRVESEPGVGSTFTIDIPLVLAC